MIDTEFVRSKFPALAGDWVFLDNAGGSQILEPVMRRVGAYWSESNVQLGGTYAVSETAGARVSAGQAAMAAYVNAADPSEVIMGPATSMLLRILALSLARTWRPGDEVIVTDTDHEANIGPWVELERSGITVKTWQVDHGSWRMEPETLAPLMTDRTRLVAVTHASNILGAINPIKEIARIAHEYGAMLCVDGVAYGPHRRIDVRELDVDFYAVSLYKVYGPHQAMLYGRHAHLLALPRFNHFFISEDAVPLKFQPGGPNFELTYGMLGLHDYLDAFAAAHGGAGGTRAGDALDPVPVETVRFVFDIVAAHEAEMAERLLAFLRAKPNVRIIGPAGSDPSVRMPTVSFIVDDRMSDTITREVDAHRIGIRYGDFYARRLIETLGLSERNGVVRVSMVHYNTLDEVDRLIAVLDEIL